MNRPRLHTRPTSAGLRVGACLLAAAVAGTAGAATAQARPQVDVSTDQSTARVADEEHGLLLFINKTRADLCTPERIAFENALEEWFDTDMSTDPPAEPAESRVGVGDVVLTTTQVDPHVRTRLRGAGLPVEVWRLDDEEGGIDCTATDGPGAELFASGPMDWSVDTLGSERSFDGDFRVAGTLAGTDGGRWSYEVRYLVKGKGGRETLFQPLIRLVPLG